MWYSPFQHHENRRNSSLKSNFNHFMCGCRRKLQRMPRLQTLLICLRKICFLWIKFLQKLFFELGVQQPTLAPFNFSFFPWSMPSHTPTRKYHSQKKEKNNKFNLGYSTTEEIENSLLTFSIFKEYSPFFFFSNPVRWKSLCFWINS